MYDVNNIPLAMLCSVYKKESRRREKKFCAWGEQIRYTVDIDSGRGNHAVSSAVGHWQGRPSGTMKQKYLYSNTNEPEPMFKCQ